MAKKIFDFVIVGSGPSAIGALIGVKKKNFAVITGEANHDKKLYKKNIHKKILYEELNSNKSFLTNIFKSKKNSIFSISKVGGFGNYWGQGCEYVPFEKLNNKKIFKNKPQYLKIINYIYTFFNIERNNRFIKLNNQFYYPSPLLKNSPNKNNTNLMSFKTAYSYLVNKKNFLSISSSVIKIKNINNNLEIKLKNKKKILTKKIFLSANTVGNSKILFESDKDIEKMSFYDDCPKKIYAISFNKKFNNFIKNHYSIISSKLNNYFISTYNMQKIDLGFILFYIFGIKINSLEKYKSSFLGMINFFQFWNKSTRVQAILTRNMTYFEKKKTNQKILNYSKILKSNSIYPIFVSDTRFGEGFHFHNLKIKKNKKWYDLEFYLRKNYNNKVFCIDASNENKINPGPFTISQMAIAYQKINLINK